MLRLLNSTNFPYLNLLLDLLYLSLYYSRSFERNL